MRELSKSLSLAGPMVFAAIYSWQNGESLPELRFYLLSLIAMAYIYSAEMAFQRLRMKQWEETRSLGRTRFVLWDYVLLRGGGASVILLLLLSLKVTISLIVLVSVLPLLALMVIVGNIVWNDCEHQYQEAVYRATATSFAVQQN